MILPIAKVSPKRVHTDPNFIGLSTRMQNFEKRKGGFPFSQIKYRPILGHEKIHFGYFFEVRQLGKI